MQNNIIIKNFQLRAARSVLGIGVREIGHCLGLSGAAISIWEHKGNLENGSSAFLMGIDSKGRKV